MPLPESRVYVGMVRCRSLPDQRGLEARAIVHCSTKMEFDAFIRDYLFGKGIEFLSSANVCEPNSWFSTFGYDGEIAAFARQAMKHGIGVMAFADTKTKLSVLPDIKSDFIMSKDEEKEYLLVKDIPNICPLDPQFGLFPKKVVPDELMDAIFSNANPNNFPEERPLLTYAILDAAKIINLVGILDSAGLDYCCLFEGEDAKILKDVAPYLVCLDKDNDFSRSLFTRSHMPDALWDKNAAIYLRSLASLDELEKGYKELTKAYEQDGAFYYFRFWDGEFSYVFFDQLKTSKDQVCRFFYPAGKLCSIIVFSLENKAARIFWPININSSIPINQLFTLDAKINEIFKKVTLKRFEKEVVKWLTELDEKRFRPFGENRLYSIAQHAIKEGNKLNFEFKEEYIYFIYVMSYCGGWFHKSEIFSDIGGLFNDDIGAERLVRAKTLFPILLEKQFGSMDKLFMEYMRFPNQIEWMIAQAGGVGNIGFHHVGLFALNSAKRIGLHDYGRLKKFMELMYAQYPEKSGNENSRALYALLSMIFGKHFMHDPFYPWVSEMMKNKTTLQEGLVAVLQYAIRRSEKFARLNGDVGYA
jgi:hypothetical protein